MGIERVEASFSLWWINPSCWLTFQPMVKVVVWSFLQLQGGVASDKLISFWQVLGKLIKMKDDKRKDWEENDNLRFKRFPSKYWWVWWSL